MASPKFRLPLIRTILAFVILHSSHAKNDIIPGLIHLPTIPTETCDGTEGKGTATFSTQFPGNTGGVINIDPAGFGDQKGAQWKLWSGPDTHYDVINIAGLHAGYDSSGSESALSDLLKINSDGSSIYFNISDPSVWVSTIILQVSQQTTTAKAKEKRATGATSTATAAASCSFNLSPHCLCNGKSYNIMVAVSKSSDTTYCAGEKTTSAGFSNAYIVTKAPPSALTKASSSTTNPTSVASRTRSIGPPPTKPFVVTATGVWACSSGAGLGTTLSVNPAPSHIALLCSQNQIPLNSDAWKQYGVSSYLSSLYASATNAPGHAHLAVGGISPTPLSDPLLDMGAALRSDAAITQNCDLEDLCNPISCADVRGSGPVDKDDPARFLAYNSYVNINNLFYQIWRAITNAHIVESASSTYLIQTFFTQTPPDVLWKSITGAVSPFISLTAVILSFISSVLPSNTVSSVFLISGIISSASGIAGSQPHNPQLEQGFIENANLSQVVQGYVTNMTLSVQAAYNLTLKRVSGFNYINFSNSGAGLKSYYNSNTDLSDQIIKTVSDVFVLRAINWLLAQDNAFIMWLPYGAPLVIYSQPLYTFYSEHKKPVVLHNFTSFSQEDCEKSFLGGDNATTFTNCNAGGEGKGMGRIYQLTGKVKENSYRSAVTGWNSNYKTPGGWTFNLSEVIDGSVRSWQAGGFNFTLDNEAETSTLGGLLENFTDSPLQIGTFTLPVCAPVSTYKTNDHAHGNDWVATNQLAPFPDAKTEVTGYDGPASGPTIWTSCISSRQYKNTTGGPKFADNVTPDILSAMKPWSQSYYSTPQ